MLYQEYEVSPPLNSFILCYWKFLGPDNGKPINHFITPDASPSLVFVSNPKYGFKGTSLFGPTKYISETPVLDGSITMGIRFKPGYIFSLFGLTGQDLREQNIKPAPPMGNLDYQSALNLLDQKDAIFSFLDKELIKTIDTLQAHSNQVVKTAIQLILQSKGNIKIAELLKQIPLSERQLQKIFKREVGLSLKEFAITMRLRAAIISIELEKTDYQDVVFESGYYDQAHFIRDFSKLSKISLPKFKKYIKNIRHVDVKFRQ